MTPTRTWNIYANLAQERPFLGTVLAIGLGSLAGIPRWPASWASC